MKILLSALLFVLRNISIPVFIKFIMQDDSQVDEKINSFKRICEKSKCFSIDISNALAGSLRTSNLFKIAIKGMPSFRFDDTGVIQLVEAVIKSNIQLVDLSLPYHRITGNAYSFFNVR